MATPTRRAAAAMLASTARGCIREGGPNTSPTAVMRKPKAANHQPPAADRPLSPTPPISPAYRTSSPSTYSSVAWLKITTETAQTITTYNPPRIQVMQWRRRDCDRYVAAKNTAKSAAPAKQAQIGSWALGDTARRRRPTPFRRKAPRRLIRRQVWTCLASVAERASSRG